MKKENAADILESILRSDFEDYTENTEATEAAKEAAKRADERARAALAWIQRVEWWQKFYMILVTIVFAVFCTAIWIFGDHISILKSRVEALEGKCAIEQPEQPEQPECKCK